MVHRLFFWLQRLYLLGFILFTWWVEPFSRFPPRFGAAWSLVVALSGLTIPTSAQEHGAAQRVVAVLLILLTVSTVSWSVLDFSLLLELAWALTPLLFLARFSLWGRLRP